MGNLSMTGHKISGLLYLGSSFGPEKVVSGVFSTIFSGYVLYTSGQTRYLPFQALSSRTCVTGCCFSSGRRQPPLLWGVCSGGTFLFQKSAGPVPWPSVRSGGG